MANRQSMKILINDVFCHSRNSLFEIIKKNIFLLYLRDWIESHRLASDVNIEWMRVLCCAWNRMLDSLEYRWICRSLCIDVICRRRRLMSILFIHYYVVHEHAVFVRGARLQSYFNRQTDIKSANTLFVTAFVGLFMALNWLETQKSKVLV